MDPELANASLGAEEEVAQLRARAIAALAGVLPGAAAAAYANIRSGSAGAICGQLDAGDGLGPRAFLVTPTGAAILSPTPELRLEDPNDPFPDSYMQYCASTEELVRLGEMMKGIRPSETAPLPLSGETIALPDNDAAGAEGVEEPLATPPDSRQRRPADDSFFNSVLRTPRSGTPPG